MVKHSWELMTAVRNDTALVVGVCAACGLIRRSVVRNEKHIDLRGDCPGEP